MSRVRQGIKNIPGIFVTKHWGLYIIDESSFQLFIKKR